MQKAVKRRKQPEFVEVKIFVLLIGAINWIVNFANPVELQPAALSFTMWR